MHGKNNEFKYIAILFTKIHPKKIKKCKPHTENKYFQHV